MSWLPRLVSCCVGAASIALASCVMHGATVFERAHGEWGWLDDQSMSCASHPHAIAFVDGNRRAQFEIKAPTAAGAANRYFYRVLNHDGQSITMQLEAETEKSKDGAPIVWVFTLVDDNTYVWRRTDWPVEKTTGKIVRCKRA